MHVRAYVRMHACMYVCIQYMHACSQKDLQRDCKGLGYTCMYVYVCEYVCMHAVLKWYVLILKRHKVLLCYDENKFIKV